MKITAKVKEFAAEHYARTRGREMTFATGGTHPDESEDDE
jgi:hypothetical protein